MVQVFLASLVLAVLIASSGGMDSGIILRMDDCALVNLVTDTLLGLDLLHSAAKDPSILKKIGKKGSSPIKGISKMKIESFAFTGISLTFLPGYGMEMFVTTKSAVSGKSIVGGKTEMKMEVKIISKTTLTHQPPACPKFSAGECKTEILDVKTNLPKGVLPSVMENFVDKTLKKMLPGLMCPPVDKVLHIMDGLLCNETATYQVGTSSSVQYNISKLPEVTENFLEVHFDIMINPELKKDAAKKSVHSDLPMKQHATTLTMSVDYLNGIMHALQEEGAFNINVTVPEDLLKAFVGMIPGIPPNTTSLEVKLMVEKPSEVILNPDKALFVLQPTMEVLASTSEANLQSLFVLSTPLDIQAQFSVEGLTLRPSLLLEGISLSVASSSFGSFDVIVTGGFVKAVMYTYTFTINELLGAGVPLPTLMSINFDNAEKEMNDGLLMFSIDACKDKRKL